METSMAKKRSRKNKPRDTTSSHSLPFLNEPSTSLFPSKGELLRLVAVLAIAASVSATCHFIIQFLNRRPKPFCDSVDLLPPDSLYRQDFCEPCPTNAHCHDGKFECVRGYQKHGKMCIEDGVINRRAKELSELLEQYICDAHARVLCGEAGNIWFQEADVARTLDEQIAKRFSFLKDDDLEYAKLKSMERVESSLERRDNFNGIKEIKCPESLAVLHKSTSCLMRQWIHRNIGLIILSTFLLIVSLRILWRIHQRRVLSKRTEQLYNQVCDILEDNALNCCKGDRNESEPWVVASWLRDHLLLPKERKNVLLWKKVEELIQEDSRIDQYPRIIKGESKIVLEWQVDGTLSSKIKRMQAAEKSRSGGNVSASSMHQEKKDRKPIFGVKLFS
ncbi:man1-Src1p-carboxy-terminal domain protein [Carex rostrata]